jgi:hypothetical protein
MGGAMPEEGFGADVAGRAGYESAADFVSAV